MSGAPLQITHRWLADAVSGRLLSDAGAAPVGRVITDTRRLEPGDFFIALRGPHFDGHSFLDEARARGATGALVERGSVGQPWGAMVEVDDTLRALQALAHEVRRSSETRVIAITGSAGKTTTKEAMTAVLRTRHRVVCNEGNLNNQIGLPLSLMALRSRPDVAVMELGMNHAGEISRLVQISEPDVRVWTNVGDAHLGFFSSSDAIADAKSEILEGASADSLLVCNADDDRVMQRVSRFPGRRVTFGLRETADVRAEALEDRGIDGVRARIVTPVGSSPLSSALIGRANLSNALAAAAVGLEFDVPLDEIAESLSALTPVDRRGVVHRLRDGIVVIDDSYNSSPAALRQALDVIASDVTRVRTIGVLGEMLELGRSAVSLHESCGRAAASAGLSRLVTVGGEAARAMATAAVAAGLPDAAVTCCPDSTQAADIVASLVAPNDLVLIKGSRGIRMDRVTDRLLAEHG